MMLDMFSMLLCLYCAPKETLELYPLLSSENDIGTRINQGIIYCNSCKRFYMIKDEILYLSLDKLREKEDELSFLQEYKSDLPEKIIFEAKPYNLVDY